MAVVLEQEVKVVRQLQGEDFYASSIPEALRQAQKHAANGGFVASMPHLVKARNCTSFDSAVWNSWYTANSEEHSGKGEFRKRRGEYVLLIHGGVDGGGMLSPEAIGAAITAGLNSTYGAVLGKVFPGKNVFADALHGGLPDGSTFPILSFDELRDGGAQRYLADFKRFGVVLPRGEVGSSGQHNIAGLPNNKLYVARIANVADAATYAEKAGEKWRTKQLGNWHPFKNVNFDEPQCRVLFLDDDYGGGLGGDDLYDFGRFVGVAPEALAARGQQVSQALESRVQAALSRGEAFEHNGLMYVPGPVKAGNLTLKQ